MKTLVVSKYKKIMADFNVGTVFEAISVIKNNNLSIVMVDGELENKKDGLLLLNELLKYSKYGWIKLPQQIIIIESDEVIKNEMNKILKQMYF